MNGQQRHLAAAQLIERFPALRHDDLSSFEQCS
jgi:hypothetical protein